MSKARQLADLGNVYDDGALSNRNLIINGAMQVAQRGTSTTTQGFATVDRFRATSDGTMVAAVVTQSQDTTGPQGFSNSYKVSVGTSETVAAVDYYYVGQGIEAQNLQQLSFGTSYAKSITLSFWVKSSVTGTYTVSLFRHDSQRIFPKTYTVSTANTWEKKVIVVDGDFTGTIADDNGRGIDLYWGLSAGSNYTTGTDGAWAAYSGSNFLPNHTADIIGTANATWQITGVQLEVGDTATPFEHRPYSDQLQNCQRYYYRRTAVGSNGSYYRYVTGFYISTTVVEGVLEMPVEMRATPSLSSAGTFAGWDSVGVRSATTVAIGGDGSSKQTISLNISGISGGTQFRPAEILSSANASSYLELSAEF
jgi:hypothetical protein